MFSIVFLNCPSVSLGILDMRLVEPREGVLHPVLIVTSARCPHRKTRRALHDPRQKIHAERTQDLVLAPIERCLEGPRNCDWRPRIEAV